jgi:hypothetical protein
MSASEFSTGKGVPCAAAMHHAFTNCIAILLHLCAILFDNDFQCFAADDPLLFTSTRESVSVHAASKQIDDAICGLFIK